MIFLSSDRPSALFPAGHRYFSTADSPPEQEHRPTEATLDEEESFPLDISSQLLLATEGELEPSDATSEASESRSPPEVTRQNFERGEARSVAAASFRPVAPSVLSDASRQDLPIMEHYLGADSDEESDALRPSSRRRVSVQSRRRVLRDSTSSEESETAMIAQEVKKNTLVSSDDSSADEGNHVRHVQKSGSGRSASGSKKTARKNAPTSRSKSGAKKQAEKEAPPGGEQHHQTKVVVLEKPSAGTGRKRKQPAAKKEDLQEGEAAKSSKASIQKRGGKKGFSEEEAAVAEAKIPAIKIKNLKEAAATRARRAALEGGAETESDYDSDASTDFSADESAYEDESSFTDDDYDDDDDDDDYDDDAYDDESESESESGVKKKRRKTSEAQSVQASSSGNNSKSFKSRVLNALEALMARRRRYGRRRRRTRRSRYGRRRRRSGGVRKKSRMRRVGSGIKRAAQFLRRALTNF